MASHLFCDGVRRRDFLRVGLLGTTGLSLSSYLRMAEAGELKNPRARSAIFIFLQGGPSHMDTFDLKPNASSELRGEFSPIQTNVPGVEISEHLPKLATCADKFAVMRGVSHNLGAHRFGVEYLSTGNRPLPSLQFPGYGAVVSKEMPGPVDLPDFVAVPRTPETSGYLGIRHAPFQTNAAPQSGRTFNVRGISLNKGLTLTDLERRRNLLKEVDTAMASHEAHSDLLQGLGGFSDRAYSIISSSRAREAFDIAKESPAITRMFDRSSFSQSCLLASRLVESGVRFVTLSTGGWDTHQDNFGRLKDRQLPMLDDGVAGLLKALDLKGLLETTTVFMVGEFGRTPKINERGGRDHYPRAMFALMAGGGLKGGLTVGESDAEGKGPKGEPITPDDLAATFYKTLGIDIEKEYHTSTGRPVMIVRNGKPIRELFA
ncbi:hypothetical protein Pan216_43230 [Planctomycetes bacterium Pan216]|uniref:Sulfatase n=1 Tax=Kolteria novifilia TaxID=2527975 RepID=A0A518B907_9BACT|nr:hypothetical protein Pan216_43230 [Planctomycetes bacterium Pan216]